MKYRHAFVLLVLLVVGCADIEDSYEPASFKRDGNSLVMTGVIDSNIATTLEAALATHPDIHLIVLQNVEGSIDDEANLEAARIVRQYDLDTHVPADGMIASGGTDFFLAGVERTIEAGALIGVHAWGGDDIADAAALPDSHPEHQPYLRYYQDMGIPQSFYWYTLDAAPSEDIHWMTQAEIHRYQLTTN